MKTTTAIISILMVMLSLPRLHSQEPVRPAFLKEGDKIAIISPASVPDKLFVDGGAEILRQWGLIPVYGTHVCSQNGTFAGTITQRGNDLQWALTDPRNKSHNVLTRRIWVDTGTPENGYEHHQKQS